MFQLHDRTRRRIVRTGFLLLCVVPTLIVLASAVAWRLPGHRRSEAERLSARLGVSFSIADLRHPRPGVVVYQGLQLADAETGRLIAQCLRLDAAKAPGPEKGGPALTLAVSEPVLETDQLDLLCELLRRVLRRQSGWRDIKLRLAAEELTLNTHGKPSILNDVEGTIETLPTGVGAEITFRPAGLPMAEPVRLRVARDRRASPPSTSIGVDTGGARLPCSLLTAILPELEALGDQSQFSGCLWASQTTDGWQGELAGQFDQIDLGRLFGNQSVHRLSGPLRLNVQTARFSQGRLRQAAGSIEAGPGQVGRSLLAASSLWLGMVVGADSASLGDPIAYQQLAVAFSIDSGGLDLRGQCARTPAGVVLAGRYGPLLFESATQPQPPAALAGLLVEHHWAPTEGWSDGRGEILVPFSSRTDWLISHLPPADATGAPQATASVPAGTISR